MQTFAACLAFGAVEWTNVDAGHYLGGRKASPGYLQGKVVLVFRWDAREPNGRAMLSRLEDIWNSFKTKQFVMLGSQVNPEAGADEVKKLIAGNGISFPMYSDASLTKGFPKFKNIPLLYVVDETGRVVYIGEQDRNATTAIVTALTELDSPKNVEQWKKFLDFELENLPGHGYLRLQEFWKRFPAEAKAYAQKAKELSQVPDVKKIADLVLFAKRARDPRMFGEREQLKKAKFRDMIETAIAKYAPLRESSDPRVVQEAKNSLADLKWALATF